MKINKYIEHTLLKPEATIAEIEQLANEAIEHDFLGICINPTHIKHAKKLLMDSEVKIVTVIGFPLGANDSSVKAFETKKAIEDGADEVDMVINIGALKDKKHELIENDIKAVVLAANGTPVKVIIETDLLNIDEIKKASELTANAKAQFVKTSTGFVKNGVGAKVDDVKLMYATVKDFGLQIKASGGVRDKNTALALIDAGATRLGTSSGVKLVSDEDFISSGGY